MMSPDIQRALAKVIDHVLATSHASEDSHDDIRHAAVKCRKWLDDLPPLPQPDWGYAPDWATACYIKEVIMPDWVAGFPVTYKTYIWFYHNDSMGEPGEEVEGMAPGFAWRNLSYRRPEMMP